MSDETEHEHALIHLNVPCETKARWVRVSRAKGLRLTDWITGIVEAELHRANTGTERGREDRHEDGEK